MCENLEKFEVSPPWHENDVTYHVWRDDSTRKKISKFDEDDLESCEEEGPKTQI